MNTDKLGFIKELLLRLKTEKPEFFKKFQAVFITLGICMGIFYGLLQANFFHGEWVAQVQPWVLLSIAFFGGGTVSAQTTTVKPELQDDKTKENVVKSLNSAEIADIKTK